MVRTGVLAATVAWHATAGHAAWAQTPAAQLALVATYGDGRVTESAVGPKGYRAWTPYFPRVEDWREPDGILPVTALNLYATLDADGIRVAVSVLRGRAREIVESVATVHIGGNDQVVVEDLRRVGLLPVTFTIKPFATPALYAPRTSSRVAGLVIDAIEPVGEPLAAYEVTVRNTTDVPVVTIAFDAFAGEAPALSGQQGDASALPIVRPGETFTFRLPLSGSRGSGQTYATAAPLDDVVVTGAIWADGRTTGERTRLGPLLALHRGRLAALTTVTQVLRAEADRPEADAVAAVRRVAEAVARVPSAADAMAVASVMRLVPSVNADAAEGVSAAISVGSRNVRQRLLADLNRVMPGLTPAHARQWLDNTRSACDDWLTRLHALFPAR